MITRDNKAVTFERRNKFNNEFLDHVEMRRRERKEQQQADLGY